MISDVEQYYVVRAGGEAPDDKIHAGAFSAQTDAYNALFPAMLEDVKDDWGF